MERQRGDCRDDLLRDERIREGEDGILHVAGIGTRVCALGTALQLFDKGKDLVAQDGVDVLCFPILKDAPTHLLPRCVRREDAREVRAEECRRLFVIRLHIIE